MNIICLDEKYFPKKSYNVDDYIKNLPQTKLEKIKREFYILFTKLDLF